MRSRVAVTAVVFVLGAGAQNGTAGPNPVLLGDQEDQRCTTAFELAQEAFHRAAPNLFWPVVRPDHPTIKAALYRNGRDISGGDGIIHDPEVFERIEPEDAGYRAVYWQRKAASNLRLVVVDQRHNWQGDWYYSFFLPEDRSKRSFFSWLSETPQEAYSSALGVNQWNPPLVLFDAKGSSIGLIDLGHPARPLHPWTVFEAQSAPLCTIDFLGGGAVGLDRLPRPVQRIAKLLDEALGSELNGGTLNPVGRLRANMIKRWATATNRPWALVSPPYNTRAEVDTGLEAWADVTPSRAKVQREIQKLYKPAEEALAEYYAAEFSLDPASAAEFSEYAMDILYRGHFVFRRDKPRGPDPVSPWPQDVR
ncbi:MAG: hypothetical protein AAGC81_13385 [Pseudomonadota bacterium]